MFLRIAIVLTACGIETELQSSPLPQPSLSIAIVLTACGIETDMPFHHNYHQIL